MPLDADDLNARGRIRPGVVRKEDEIDFRDLIYGMAESIADAQVKLDYELAETTTRFAETTVEVVPRVVRTIEADGTVTHEPQPTERRSLLDLGLAPTRYQFSEATVDVEFDLSFATDETDTRDDTRKARFRVDTSEAHHRRRYHGEANTTAKVSARLVPVPTPASLTPATVDATVVDDRDEPTPGDGDGSDRESRPTDAPGEDPDRDDSMADPTGTDEGDETETDDEN